MNQDENTNRALVNEVDGRLAPERRIQGVFSKLKVVFVTKGYHSAAKGAESAARNWYLRIKDSVDESLLVTDRPSMISRAIGRSPFSFIVAANPLTFIMYAIATSRRLKKICRETSPDLVHIHCYSGYIAIPPSGTPTLVTFHDEPFIKIIDTISPAPIRFLYSLLQYSQNFMRKLILWRKPFVQALGTTVSTLIAQKFPGIESRVIPNPFFISDIPPPTKTREQITQELGIPLTAKIVLTVGHIAIGKAVHKILDASIHLGQSSDIHFVLAGKSPNFISQSYSRKIMERAAEMNAATFHMIGYIEGERLQNLYHHSDMYLSVSQSEACNLALIEAASYHLPIITTDVGAARNLFAGKAFFLERNCSFRDVALVVSEKIGSPHVEYELLRDLTWEKAMNELLSFYKHIGNR